jgi:pilus assembly protein Flp/PilA
VHTSVTLTRNHGSRVALERAEENGIMKALFNRFVREESGQDMLEYALLTALIALAAVTAITAAGASVDAIFTDIAAQINP